MNREKIISDALSISNTLVSTVNFKNKTVSVYFVNGVGCLTLSFNEFVTFFSAHYSLIPNFTARFVRFLENLGIGNEVFESYVEYSSSDNKIVRIKFHGARENEDEFLLMSTAVPYEGTKQLDELTKAYNLSYVVENVDTAIKSSTPFAMMIIDIDYFKKINAEYGHIFGDIILVEVVASIKKIIKNNGFIARVGGDEFLVFINLEDYGYDTVHELCSSIKNCVRKVSETTLKSLILTVTIGSITYPTDGDNFEILYRKAIRALNRGKDKGRNCFIMYTTEKCGPVSLDDDLAMLTKSIDSSTTQGNVFACISSLVEILNDEGDFDENIETAINLLGGFYGLDRMEFIRLDIKKDCILKKHTWHNPKTPIHYDYYAEDGNILKWREEMGEKKYIRIDRFIDTPSFKMNEEFKKDHTTATMSFDIIAQGNVYGLIRFDMTSGPREWQKEEIQQFMLISKIFSVHLNRNYIQETHYKHLFYDSECDCYNYNKFYLEVSEFVIKNRSKYQILEFGIKEYLKLINVIGRKKYIDVLVSIKKQLQYEKNIIFGRRFENAFIIFIPNHNKEDVYRIFDSCYAAVRYAFGDAENNNIIINGGCKISDSSEDLADNIEKASLTRAEKNRTSNLMFYNEEIYNANKLKSELFLHLKDALASDEFMLYLQPKFNPHTNEIVGAEALTRWNYKNVKMIYPDTFIPLFEQYGVIQELDYKVFDNVCDFQKNIIAEGYDPIPISVNVSRYISNFDEYLKCIEEIRKKYGISAKYIEIEITEGMFFSNIDVISNFIEKLHKIGYKVSMDDFGSGYSNFLSLTKLNFDVIKLDKSFCDDLTTNKGKLMVSKIMDMVKSLNMGTLCEGVETKENVEYLKDIGCDIIQGYYYDKPLPHEEFKTKYIK